MLVVLLLGVLIGWLLAPRCHNKTCTSGDGTVSGEGGASSGKGSPMKLSPGDGSGDPPSGSGHASGAVRAGGGGMAGDNGGGVDSDGGRAGGHNGDGPGGQQGGDSGDPLGSEVARHAQGLDTQGAGSTAQGTGAPAGKLLTAPDFTYDKTGLPHYPNAQQVQSALFYRNPADTQNWSSSVGITTADSFDTVVAWYKAQLPPGWQADVIGDMQQLKQQLSMQNIAAMLSAAAQEDADSGNATAGDAAASAGTAPGRAATPAPTDPSQRQRVAVFKPPAGAPGRPTLLVSQHGDQAVAVMLGAKNP